MLRITLACLLAVAFLASYAHATDPVSPPPDDKDPIRSRQEQQMHDEAQTRSGTALPFPRQFIMGQVRDSGGIGIGGTTVKLFADGVFVEEDRTNSSGEFELNLPLNIETDETVVLWVVPPTDRYAMQCVVIKKSEVARNSRLFGPCAIEVEMKEQMRVEVALLTPDELLQSVRARGCY
ncbi:MAG: hypothetical protein PVF95_00520 [bacterium]|jgi:hypothetical protein